jgi:hypothetical protein
MWLGMYIQYLCAGFIAFAVFALVLYGLKYLFERYMQKKIEEALPAKEEAKKE